GNAKEHDRATGLANHGFRYYDPAAGRYLSEDPLGYDGGFNLHLHCANDPVNKFDPLGLFWEEAWDARREIGDGGTKPRLMSRVSRPMRRAAT
ncbi:MAG: RHS repeat-associated core domain-containing protein, partial [Planctomycetes bacterium]|nr:RHS repeat-associated core domain-containing protein [Planctomycetota bacterium]